MVALEVPCLPQPEFKTSKNSGSFGARVQRGAELYRQGDTAGTLREYNAALDVAPDDSYLRRTRALLLGELGRYEEAIADFDHLIAVRPHDADPLLLKGMALFQLGRFQEAQDICQEAARLSPHDPNVHAMRGYALDALGQHREALAAFDQSLAIKDNPHVIQARRKILDADLRKLTRKGVISWGGGKPAYPARKLELTEGPLISEWIVESRR